MRRLSLAPVDGGRPWHEQVEVAAELASLAAARALPLLLRAADDRSNPFPEKFAHAAAKAAGTDAVMPLLERVGDERLLQTGEVLQAVISIGAAALPLLFTALDHEAGHVRRGAAVILGAHSHAAAAERLVALLADDVVEVQIAAAWALSRIGDAEVARESLLRLWRRTETAVGRRRIAVALDACGYRPDSIADPLGIDLLTAQHQWEALVALGAEVVPELVRGLEGADAYIHASLLSVLGLIGDRRALAAVEAGLLSEHGNVRLRAVEALGRLGDPCLVPTIVDMLAEVLDDNPDIAATCAEALGLLGDGAASAPLIDALTHSRINKVRCAAARALGIVGDHAAIAALHPLLGGANLELRAVAAAALEKLGAHATDLAEHVRRRIAAADWSGLVDEGAAAVPAILTVLPAEPAATQPELIRVLGRIGAPTSAAAVLEWLFAHPTLITDGEALRAWIETMQPLFEDLSEMVLCLSCAMQRSKRDESSRWHQNYDWIYDHRWMDEAFGDLAGLSGQVAVNLLHLVASRDDAEVEIGRRESEWWEGPITGPLSFADQRERAKRELERRGSPPADPLAYAQPGGFRRPSSARAERTRRPPVK